ncbi:MAG: GDP-mannose 4,6-dehydratase [Deinococcales bacterium]
MRHALVTGGAGFVGSHLVDRLLREGDWQVTVLDNFDPFYPRSVKEGNLARHADDAHLTVVEGDLRDPEALARCGASPIDVVVHLAARAGVRPSLEDPVGYESVNVGGTQVLLEQARRWGVPQFVFGSSSSVYGVDPHVPWHEDASVLRPISPYAATKVAGELLGHVTSHLYGMRFLALRLFTVYGPRQRPDLAIHKFARLILAGEPIPVYGDGTPSRDYTYVADVVQGIRAAMDYTASPFEVINLGHDRTVSLDAMIAALEAALGKQAERTPLPAQPGDVPRTWADLEKARRLLDYRPQTSFEEGMRAFAAWLRAH